jgi:hypothetical protein
MSTKISSNQLSAQLPMFIANMLRDDIESVQTLLKLLNDQELGCRALVGSDVEARDVAGGLETLIRKGWVDVLVYDTKQRELIPSNTPLEVEMFSNETWFRLTDLGRSSIGNAESGRAETS